MTSPSASLAGFWCGRCGLARVTKRGDSCQTCRQRPPLEAFACGVCGQPASVMFVYGYRCSKHAHQREPNQQIVSGSTMTGCHGRLRRSAV